MGLETMIDHEDLCCLSGEPCGCTLSHADCKVQQNLGDSRGKFVKRTRKFVKLLDSNQ